MIQVKLGMKMPSGLVFEIERLILVEELNQALDGHSVIGRVMNELVDEFLATLGREKDAR